MVHLTQKDSDLVNVSCSKLEDGLRTGGKSEDEVHRLSLMLRDALIEKLQARLKHG